MAIGTNRSTRQSEIVGPSHTRLGNLNIKLSRGGRVLKMGVIDERGRTHYREDLVDPVVKRVFGRGVTRGAVVGRVMTELTSLENCPHLAWADIAKKAYFLESGCWNGAQVFAEAAQREARDVGAQPDPLMTTILEKPSRVNVEQDMIRALNWVSFKDPDAQRAAERAIEGANLREEPMPHPALTAIRRGNLDLAIQIFVESGDLLQAAKFAKLAIARAKANAEDRNSQLTEVIKCVLEREAKTRNERMNLNSTTVDMETYQSRVKWLLARVSLGALSNSLHRQIVEVSGMALILGRAADLELFARLDAGEFISISDVGNYVQKNDLREWRRDIAKLSRMDKIFFASLYFMFSAKSSK